MRISDWSSDVCSSDLAIDRPDFSVTAEEIDLADVGRRAAGLFLVKARDRGIGILAPALEEAEPAIGEFRRALQILMNLVGNAVRYAPEGSTVRIETGRLGGQAWIAVLDQGDGIAADRSEEHTSELQALTRHSFAVFCFKQKQHIPT